MGNTCGSQISTRTAPSGYTVLECVCSDCDDITLVEYSDGISLYDTRDEISRVCFYAYDKYLLTNAPFYCIDLIIIEEPVITEPLLECYCRTCTTPGYRGYNTTRPTPNYAPKTAECMST